jgi:hypothetical protein
MTSAGRDLKVGQASLTGLAWLARVGPAPLEAWACGMGWRRAAMFSHAHRLEHEGWLTRWPLIRGRGSLVAATPLGVMVTGVAVTPAPRPAPTWWAHLEACGWVAAWLAARGRDLQGSREVAADPYWHGEIKWHDRRGQHALGHRPDLAWLIDGRRVAIEVELARKSTARLEAIIGLHANWRAAGRTAGVIYVCRDAAGARRVREVAGGLGLRTEKGGGLRVDELARVRQQAIDAARSARRREPNQMAAVATGLT